MRRRAWLPALVPVAAAVLVLTGAPAAQLSDPPPKNRPNNENKPPPSPGEGWIVVADDLWLDLVDEMDHHFQAAYDHFDRRDLKAAAREIRKSVVFMKLEAGRATGAERKSLEAQAAGLGRLAEAMGGAAPPLADAVRQAFGASHYEIARNHLALGRADWSSHDPPGTGQEMKAAVAHLRQGLRWIGRKPEPAADTAVVDAELVAENLAGAIGWKTDDVTRALQELGVQVDALGTALSPLR
jgi:hypothetical protein